MPQTPHVEKHFTASAAVRDVVIGMSDGLTVPFALAAGLSGAVDSAAIVVTAGVAEIAAGAIAMGLGGYLAAKTDAEHYAAERAREERETRDVPEVEAEEVAQIFREYGLDAEAVERAVAAIRTDRPKWVDLMMKFELGLDPPDPQRAGASALTIALAYIAGGFVPLAPYIVLAWLGQRSVRQGLVGSIAVTLVALLAFGYVKGRFTTRRPWPSAAWPPRPPSPWPSSSGIDQLSGRTGCAPFAGPLASFGRSWGFSGGSHQKCLIYPACSIITTSAGGASQGRDGPARSLL